MKLTELEPQFIKYSNPIETWDTVNGPVSGLREIKIFVQTLSESQGVIFLCPKCFKGSNIGVHMVEVTFSDRGVPDSLGTHNKQGKATRWNVSGNDLNDL